MSDPLFTGGNHICIATRDIDRAVRTWWDRYRVGPWRVYRLGPSTMSARLDGGHAQFEMRAALARIGPHFRVEIIQPLDGGSPYAHSLERHGGANHIHHVRFDVADFDRALDHLGGLGLRTIMDAEFAGATGDSPALAGKYIDTEQELGFVLEIAAVPSGFVMDDPEYIYPAGDEG